VSFRLAPSVSPDTQFFWDGLKDHQLLIQRCASCGVLRHPPRPMCPSCNSLEWDTVSASGRGTVHSFVMPQHPPMPFMEYPYIVALIDLEEGTRLLSNLCEVAPADASIGMPVEVFYTEFDEGLVLHQFHPAGAR
jgi:uncharacterized OB-fold protein